MAIKLIAKQMGNNGSTPGNRVVYQIWGANETLVDSDFTFTNDNGSITLNARKIETVMNCGPSAVTVDGKIYETGRWELSLIGGATLSDGANTSNSVAVAFDDAGNGNVVIEVRS